MSPPFDPNEAWLGQARSPCRAWSLCHKGHKDPFAGLVLRFGRLCPSRKVSIRNCPKDATCARGAGLPFHRVLATWVIAAWIGGMHRMYLLLHSSLSGRANASFLSFDCHKTVYFLDLEAHVRSTFLARQVSSSYHAEPGPDCVQVCKWGMRGRCAKQPVELS